MKIRTTLTLTSVTLSLTACVTAPREYRVYTRYEPVPQCQYNAVAQPQLDEYQHRQREMQKRINVMQRFMRALETRVIQILHKFDEPQPRETDKQASADRSHSKHWW
ncbi:MAG: hypothetical protein ACWA44_08770 [Thiotrichales bacterium]